MFSDIAVVPNSVYAIEKLRRLGYVKGIGDNLFDPLSPMTRAQIAVLIVRAQLWPDFEPKPEKPYFFSYAPKVEVEMPPDVPQDAWYYEWVRMALGLELMDTIDGKFLPDSSARRADVVSLFVAVMQEVLS